MVSPLALAPHVLLESRTASGIFAAGDASDARHSAAGGDVSDISDAASAAGSVLAEAAAAAEEEAGWAAELRPGPVAKAGIDQGTARRSYSAFIGSRPGWDSTGGPRSSPATRASLRVGQGRAAAGSSRQAAGGNAAPEAAAAAAGAHASGSSGGEICPAAKGAQSRLTAAASQNASAFSTRRGRFSSSGAPGALSGSGAASPPADILATTSGISSISDGGGYGRNRSGGFITGSRGRSGRSGGGGATTGQAGSIMATTGCIGGSPSRRYIVNTQ